MDRGSPSRGARPQDHGVVWLASLAAGCLGYLALATPTPVAPYLAARVLAWRAVRGWRDGGCASAPFDAHTADSCQLGRFRTADLQAQRVGIDR